MGAQFSLPVVTEVEAADLQGRFAAMAAKGRSAPRILVADSNGGTDVREVAAGLRAAGATAASGVVLVLGSERSGPVASGRAAAGDYPAAPVRLAQRGHGRHRAGLRVEPICGAPAGALRG